MILLLLFARAATAAVFREPVYELVAPGAAYAEIDSDRHRLVCHVLKADLREMNKDWCLQVQTVKARGKETLAHMTRRLLKSGKPLVAAINGDYFERKTAIGLPWGVQVCDRELLFSPSGKAAFALDSQGRPFIAILELRSVVVFPDRSSKAYRIIEVNRPREDSDTGFYLYTRRWGSEHTGVAGGLSIVVKSEPLHVGKLIKGEVSEVVVGKTEVSIPEEGLVLTVTGRRALAFRRLEVGDSVAVKALLDPPAVEAIGGGPRIVRNGRPSIDFQAESFSASHRKYLNMQNHPRSAIGYDRSRSVVLLVVVEGRTSESKGLTMPGLSKLMVALGAWDAMAFDGGGSATMYVCGKMVTYRSAAEEKVKQRQLANALGVFYRKKGPE